jgi:hypothetical protein
VKANVVTLPAPSYIPIVEISSPSVDYEWDSWDPYELLGQTNGETLDALAGVSNRGIVTFAIGCSEWVIYRLLPHMSERHASSARLYLEAWWAFVMGAPIAIPLDVVEKEWPGKNLAPVALALITINNAWRLSENGEADTHGGFAERLPLLVLKDPQPFIVWEKKVLKRLEYFHPYDEGDGSMGALIAREILDPTIDLKGIEESELVRRTIEAMNLKNNQYVQWL